MCIPFWFPAHFPNSWTTYFSGKTILVASKKVRLPLATPLGVHSPFFSTIVLLKNQLFPLGFRWLSGKNDPWKEWTCKCPLELQSGSETGRCQTRSRTHCFICTWAGRWISSAECCLSGGSSMQAAKFVPRFAQPSGSVAFLGPPARCPLFYPSFGRVPLLK